MPWNLPLFMLVKSFLSFVTHDSALKILDWLFTPYPLYLNYSQYSNFPIVHGFVLKTVWSIVCLIHFSTYRSLIASLGRCWGEGQCHSLHLLSVSSLVKDDKKWKEGKDVVDLSRGSCRSAQGLAQGTQREEALVSDLALRFVLCINYFFLKQKRYFKSNLKFLENSIQCILILLNCIAIPGKQFKWGRIYLFWLALWGNACSLSWLQDIHGNKNKWKQKCEMVATCVCCREREGTVGDRQTDI